MNIVSLEYKFFGFFFFVGFEEDDDLVFKKVWNN